MVEKITLGALETLLAAKIAARRRVTVPELVNSLIQHEAALELAFGSPIRANHPVIVAAEVPNDPQPV